MRNEEASQTTQSIDSRNKKMAGCQTKGEDEKYKSSHSIITRGDSFPFFSFFSRLDHPDEEAMNRPSHLVGVAYRPIQSVYPVDLLFATQPADLA